MHQSQTCLLGMHRFCSFDNWLCNPISANWQLMLDGHLSLCCADMCVGVDEYIGCLLHAMLVCVYIRT